MGSAAALGAAGSGALGGIAQRRTEDYERSVSQFNMADEGARAALAEGRQEPGTLNTGEGILQYNPETGEYEPMINKETGLPYTSPALTGKPPVDKWKIDWMVKHWGISEAEAGRRVMTGVTPEQVRADALTAWRRFESGGATATISVGNTVYTKRLMKKAEIIAVKKQYMAESLAVFDYPPEAGTGKRALSGAGGSPALDKPAPREKYEGGWLWNQPDGMDTETWKNYEAMRDEVMGE